MDALTHTLLATACLAFAFYVGVYLSRREAMQKSPTLFCGNLNETGSFALRLIATEMSVSFLWKRSVGKHERR